MCEDCQIHLQSCVKDQIGFESHDKVAIFSIEAGVERGLQMIESSYSTAKSVPYGYNLVLILYSSIPTKFKIFLTCSLKAGVGSLFVITGCINCGLSLAGRKKTIGFILNRYHI